MVAYLNTSQIAKKVISLTRKISRFIHLETSNGLTALFSKAEASQHIKIFFEVLKSFHQVTTFVLISQQCPPNLYSGARSGCIVQGTSNPATIRITFNV